MSRAIDATEDFALLDAWAGGDTRAASELLRRHTGALVRFFDRKLDGPIEDLVQETLVACVRGRDSFRREAGFRSYMLGIARHVLFGALKAKRRGEAIDLETSSLADLSPTPSRVIEQKRERRVLLEALRRLPVATQVLLELYHWERLSGAELAAVLGIGERATRSRLRRAMAALREEVERVAETAPLLASSWADFEGWAQALPDADD